MSCGLHISFKLQNQPLIKKIILVLDGHTIHSKNLTVIEMARENGVILLQLPGHTTHRVQPLDRTFFKPLQTYYAQMIRKWLQLNPGLCVTQYHVSELAAEAYGKAATIENATSGFKVTGIYPVDRTVFKESDFVAADNLNQIGMTSQETIIDHLEEHNLNITEDVEIDRPITTSLENSSTKDRNPRSRPDRLRVRQPYVALRQYRPSKFLLKRYLQFQNHTQNLRKPQEYKK